MPYLPEDPLYTSLDARWLIDKMDQYHDLEHIVVPGLPADAAVDLYQRAMWVRPGLERRWWEELTLDAVKGCDTDGRIRQRYFRVPARRDIRQMTSRNALIVPRALDFG